MRLVLSNLHVPNVLYRFECSAFYLCHVKQLIRTKTNHEKLCKLYSFISEKNLKTKTKTKENYRCGEFYEYLLLLITYLF